MCYTVLTGKTIAYVHGKADWRVGMKLNLGSQIRANRRRMNLTQEQLAEKFGTSPQAVSRWENGTTYPDIEMLPMIASFFETSVDALLGCTEQEKQKFCAELQEAFETAVRAKNIEQSIELMREIRRNLREYQNYWFWGLFRAVWDTRLFHDPKVLEELRLLAEEIFQVCPKDQHFAVIEQMADMEDDTHIDAFLDAYSSRQDMDREALLFHRYKMREELDKIEPVRQSILWGQIEHITTSANDWQEYLCKDPKHFIWFCETQLGYLNAINCLYPDKEHLVSGGAAPDIWCEARLQLGLRYTAALARLGNTDAAYAPFEDMVVLLEQLMALLSQKGLEEYEEFEMRCSSPALQGFTLKSNYYWSSKGEKDFCMLHDNGWGVWIIPSDYRDAVKHEWFDSLRADKRFDPLFKRLEKCVIYKEQT